MAAEQTRYLLGPDARVLSLLHEHGRITRSDFSKKHGLSYSGAVNSLRFLRDHGITDFEEIRDFRDTQVWFLTEKGKVAARKLVELVSFIEKET